MGLDVFEGIRRAFTLPASANSLSDILGPHGPGNALSDAARAITTTLHELLADAIASGVHVLVAIAETDLQAAQQFVSDRVTQALSGVSEPLALQIKAAVDAEFTSLEKLAEQNIPQLGTDLIAAIGKVLHTTG